MAGKPRLDQLEQKVARLERTRGGDALDAFLRTLPDETLAEMERRISAGEHPATVLKEFHG